MSEPKRKSGSPAPPRHPPLIVPTDAWDEFDAVARQFLEAARSLSPEENPELAPIADAITEMAEEFQDLSIRPNDAVQASGETNPESTDSSPPDPSSSS